MAAVSPPSLIIINLNVGGLNSPIKRHRVAEWIKKQNKIQLYADYKRLISDLRTHTGSKWKDRKINLMQVKGKREQEEGIPVLITDKIDFKP